MGGSDSSSMAFVRVGGRCIAYGRGERERTSWEHKMRYEERTQPAKIVIKQVGDPDTPYIQEINALSDENSQLQREIDELKAKLAGLKVTKDDYGLGSEFEFGHRIYQCEIAQPGVGYRFTPSFADKNPDGTGPESPECVFADRICQGPAAVFVRTTDGHGWVPLNDPTGKRVCFKHLGRAKDIDVKAQGLKMAEGENKLSPSPVTSPTDWWRPKSP